MSKLRLVSWYILSWRTTRTCAMATRWRSRSISILRSHIHTRSVWDTLRRSIRERKSQQSATGRPQHWANVSSSIMVLSCTFDTFVYLIRWWLDTLACVSLWILFVSFSWVNWQLGRFGRYEHWQYSQQAHGNWWWRGRERLGRPGAHNHLDVPNVVEKLMESVQIDPLHIVVEKFEGNVSIAITVQLNETIVNTWKFEIHEEYQLQSKGARSSNLLYHKKMFCKAIWTPWVIIIVAISILYWLRKPL